MSEWGDEVLRHKYDPLPEEGPRHRKRAKKKHMRSDHKHVYENVRIDAHSYVITREGMFPYYYIGTRCKVCGRLANVRSGYRVHELPEGTRLFEVKDLWTLLDMKVLPDDLEVTE